MPKYGSFSEAPLAIRKRYIQMRYAKHFIGFARFYLRIKLTVTEFKKNKSLNETLMIYKLETERARFKGNECTQALMNLGLYFLIAEKDIQTVKIDALTHHNRWKRLLSLRIVLLTIHEWDMGKASSNDLKKLLSQSSVDEELQAELFKSLRLLRSSQKKAAKILKFERNATIAHRDPDALLQLKSIELLNAKKVFSAAAEFYESSEIFMSVFPKVLQQAGSTHGLFSFMLNNKIS